MSSKHSTQTTDPDSSVILNGLVVKTHSGFYTVESEADGVLTQTTCQLRGTLKQSRERTELCVIGDRVTFETLPDGTGMITGIEPRLHSLTRIDPASTSGTQAEREQVIIANADQIVLVVAVGQPAANPRNFDRVLIAAEKAEIPSIVLAVNKMDLANDDPHALDTFKIYERIGYTVLYLSAEKSIGLDRLREMLNGKISAFAGQSGVGKSSLLNRIQDGLALRVSAVSEKLTKGRHTTVNAQMVRLDGGGYVADTPGIRSLSLWDIEPTELDAYFPEFRPYIVECQFSDCRHFDEPGCAVLQAVKDHAVSPLRLDSYQRLREQLESQYIY